MKMTVIMIMIMTADVVVMRADSKPRLRVVTIIHYGRGISRTRVPCHARVRLSIRLWDHWRALGTTAILMSICIAVILSICIAVRGLLCVVRRPLPSALLLHVMLLRVLDVLVQPLGSAVDVQPKGVVLRVLVHLPSVGRALAVPGILKISPVEANVQTVPVL